MQLQTCARIEAIWRIREHSDEYAQNAPTRRIENMTEKDSQPDSEALYEILGGIYVQMLRIYDLLALSLKGNPDLDRLISLHESGRVLAPDPALVIEDENDENIEN